MNFNKKAIESYVLALLIVSLTLTLLIMTVFSPVLANDHEKCLNIEYKILSKKKIDGGVRLNIENIGNSKIYFKFNNEENIKTPLMPETKEEYRINNKEEEIIVMPIYIDIQEEIFECRGKKTTIKTNTLI